MTHTPKHSARVPSHKVIANEAIARIGLTGDAYRGRHRAPTLAELEADLAAAVEQHDRAVRRGRAAS